MDFIIQILLGSFLCLVFLGIIIGIGYTADRLMPWEKISKEVHEDFWLSPKDESHSEH